MSAHRAAAGTLAEQWPMEGQEEGNAAMQMQAVELGALGAS